jgi:predicted nucleic acid-binding protein
VSGFLLDTNCISEVVRPTPDPRVLEWLESVNESLLYLSVVTLGEIRKGLAGLPQGQRRTRLEIWLDVDLQTRFAGRIMPIDAAVAERWGLMVAAAKQRGKTLPVIDSLLTATALHYNLTMVSRNTSDFVHTQVPVLNPWNE